MGARTVLVRALKNFDTYERSDQVIMQMTLSVASLVADGYLEVIADPWPPTSSTTPNSGSRPT